MVDKKRVERNIKWIESYCVVPEGRLFGRPAVLYESQQKIIEAIYGSYTRRVIISIPRKNGKTSFSAMLLLLHLVGPEAKPNSQLVSSAQSRDQAAILFSLASKMVRLSPELTDYVTIRDSLKQLYCEELGTLYKALSAEASTAHGLSPAFAVHDELGQVRGSQSNLYEAIETGAGAQEDPLSLIISTQAPSDIDLLSILIDDAERHPKTGTKLFLWTAPEEADPFAEETWKIANPNYGTILNPKIVQEMAETAKRMPSRESAFRNLVLNQRIDQTNQFVSRSVWTACGETPDESVLEDSKVYLGLDLSSRKDLTALSIIARDASNTWHAWVEFWAPKQGIKDRSRMDKVPYDVWADEGWITLTEGYSVDYAWPAKRLLDLVDKYLIDAIAFDRWRMDILLKEVSRLNNTITLPLRPWGQGFRDMSPAIDSLETLLLNKKLKHGNNPVLTWCVANAKATSDPAGNRKFDKKKTIGRIDGLQALAMACGVAHREEIAVENPKRTSVYEQGVI